MSGQRWPRWQHHSQWSPLRLPHCRLADKGKGKGKGKEPATNRRLFREQGAVWLR